MSEQTVIDHRLQTLHEDVVEMKTALGKLTDAVTKLALLEERQAHAAAAQERAFAAIERVETRLLKIEHQMPSAKRTSIWVDRAVLFVFGLAAMYVAKKVGLA